MSVRINFEIGHEAAIRSKRTIEGFTHDWEIFVRGCDNADIQYFVEKVVFYLHDTFTNPKRVVKEPPYRVRESGYAGFTLPIDIYLRNNEEPKKIRFTYDLNLQTTGPAICKVQKEKYVFSNPNEEFRHKLFKGGAIASGSSSNTSESSREISTSNDKAKVKSTSSDIIKKHKMKEYKQEDSFTDLFGTPITKTSKISPEPKVQPKTSPTINPVKVDKLSNPKKSKSKHSPKDKDRDKEKKDKGQEKKHKEEKKSKERSKDKERKDKTVKKEKSISPSRSPKRVMSPKRAPSPKRPPSPPPIKIKSEEKKQEEPIKEKTKTESKKSKHEQKDKEKDKDKKEHKSHKDKDKEITNRNSEPSKEHKNKEPRPVKDSLAFKKEKITKPEEPIIKEPEKPEKVEKIKVEKIETEKPKHKHKKKDSKERKEKKEEKSKEKRTEKKSEKSDNFFERIYKEEPKDSPKEIEKNPTNIKPVESIPEKQNLKEKNRGLSALQAELLEETSNSSGNSNDESSYEIPAKTSVKPEQKKKDKQKSESEKKRKRKHETNAKEEQPTKIEEPPSKISRDEFEPKFDPKFEQKYDQKYDSKFDPKPEVKKETTDEEINQDYMSILKDLQHKIMTLQDNSELQRVVQLIAETGHYEITAQTFDFDLCALDRDTVRRLQEFFTVS